jgi:hypothetical protein
MNPKLKDLLEVSGTGFKTTQTKVDPNTGRIEWDVEYYPDFSEILHSLNDLIKGLDDTIKKHSIKDSEILTSAKALKSIKSIILKTLELKHPEYIKNYH